MYLVWCLAFALAVTASGRRPQYRDVETQTDMDLVPDPPSRVGGGACCAVLTVIGMSFFVFALYTTVRDSF